MGEKLRVGVISCSGMARAHMRAVKEWRGAELAAVCDTDGERLRAAAGEFMVDKAVADYRRVLDDPDIDAVIIVTPDQLHREMSVAALKAGKHVLCEKPMALTLEDCREMTAAARASDKKMMVGQISRYTPGFMRAKELIDRGEIGELFFVETEYAHDYALMGGWRLDPLRHGFLGGGCHAVDLARWIAGDPTEVMAYSNKKMLTNWPTDDCTIAIMRFPNEVIGKVFVSTGCKRDYTMRSAFYGSKGTIITDNTSPAMTVFKEGLGNGESLFDGLQTHALPVKYPIPISSHNATGEFAEFADCILNDKPVATDAIQGAYTVSVALAVVESTKTGLPVKPDYDF